MAVEKTRDAGDDSGRVHLATLFHLVCGWVGGWLEEEKAVGMRGKMNGWVGGWLEEEKAVGMRGKVGGWVGGWVSYLEVAHDA